MIGLLANTAAEEMPIIALSPVPVEESDVETSFDTAYVLTARGPVEAMNDGIARRPAF